MPYKTCHIINAQHSPPNAMPYSTCHIINAPHPRPNAMPYKTCHIINAPHPPPKAMPYKTCHIINAPHSSHTINFQIRISHDPGTLYFDIALFDINFRLNHDIAL